MRKLCIKLIEFYQKKMSPNMNKRCRFYPSCSNYALECYKRFNFFKASFLSFWRIIRCNPWNKGGYDPVPEKKSKLLKITDSYYLYEYKTNTDRPNLAYIYRDSGSYVIDAGNSKKHIKLFYKELKKHKLPLPKFTIITHHHWDHVFGLYATNTHSIGLKETNDLLKKHKTILEEKGIKALITLKEIPAFCIDHIYLEYRGKLKTINIKLLDEEITSNKDLSDLSLLKFPSNHTVDNLVVLDKKTGVLFLGDSLCGQIKDYDFIKDKDIILKQINYLSGLKFDIAIESHQEPTTKESIIEKLKNKLEEL